MLLCHYHIRAQIIGLRAGGIKQMSWASYLFQDLGNQDQSSFRLATSTDEEINERIFATASSYNTESNQDTFKPDTVFESFHHQTKILISDKALLAGFLMLWLKRCVVPTLSHEVLAADIVYLAVLLAHD